MDIDLLVLLRHSAQFPQSERGRIVDTVWDGWRRCTCRWCGEFILLVGEETPEDRGYHRDCGRWFYCADCSEEGQGDGQ